MKKTTICMVLVSLALIPSVCFSQGGTDRDADNDGVWDYDRGGTDRDLDNDGVWDSDLGGVDRDTDNDGTWDY